VFGGFPERISKQRTELLLALISGWEKKVHLAFAELKTKIKGSKITYQSWSFHSRPGQGGWGCLGLLPATSADLSGPARCW